MARYTKKELAELPTKELASLAGVSLTRGRPSADTRAELVKAAFEAKAKKA